MGSGKGTRSGSSRLLLLAIPCTKKEWKVTPSYRSFFTEPVHKETTIKMETDKSVRLSIVSNNWAISIDLTDAYLHIPIQPQSRKYLRFVYEDQIFQFTALTFRMSLSPWIFTKLVKIIALHLCQHAISVFPYLENWLIKDLICYRLLSQTKYCLQVVKDLGFIPNLKQSELIPAQNFTFIGMEFLTTRIRVPADRVEALI